MRSGSVRSCPRQLPPHLEMTLVHCSRDFSTLRSLYPRQYWSLTTEGGAARNSYKCKYICCCVILVLLCLLLSPVLAFLYHLFPFSFVRRSSSSSSVCLFVLVYFVVTNTGADYFGLWPFISTKFTFVPNQPNRRIPCAKPILFHNFFLKIQKKPLTQKIR